MIMNFYDVESKPMYYTVIDKECAFFNEMDVATMVGYLPVDTIYQIAEFCDTTSDDTQWVKIQMHDGEYYAIISLDKCVIEEIPTPSKDNFIKRIIKKIKSIFKKI